MNEFIDNWIGRILFAIGNESLSLDGQAWTVRTAIGELLPIILIPFFVLAAIAIIALVFGILNYRTNKKILKKLEEKKGEG